MTRIVDGGEKSQQMWLHRRRTTLNLLGLFLLFSLALKVLLFGFHYKGVTQLLCDLRNGGVYSSNRYAEKSNRKTSLLGPWKNSEIRKDGNGDDTSEEEEEEVDVLALRKLVKIEKERANTANLELEKERMAATTAAHEAMAMILCLQNEKSLIEMKANQYRRLAEEKQLHDQEVIQSLRWIVMKHESERSLLEHQLSSYRRRLKLLTKGGDEGDESRCINHESLSFFNFTIEDSPADALISSLDTDSSQQHKFQL
ncbi:uncharacterized protein LOC127809405 [Diospyros lotus]|uniref:uncharacterized protein LOC127809405 n=1 Tax=Diospyros lotus TaxID=55363 RepID=UPI0022562A9F|nr:uncharacterized protein LOC127809405 [Diospyros lotus]